jgi:hypothetical protein
MEPIGDRRSVVGSVTESKAADGEADEDGIARCLWAGVGPGVSQVRLFFACGIEYHEI